MKQKEKQIIEQVVYQMIHGYNRIGFPIQNAWEIIDDDLEEMIDGELWNEDFKMESSIKEQLKQAHESFDKVLEEYENE